MNRAKTIYLVLLKAWVFSCGFSLVGFVLAAEKDVLVLRSVIKGNQEQPNVLSIVPWQDAAGPDSLYMPLHTLVNDVYAPLDRNEFRRHLKYIDDRGVKTAKPDPNS